MKAMRFLVAVILLATVSLAVTASAQQKENTRVLHFTGGHDFEREPFMKMFQDNPDITFKAVEHPNAHAMLRPDAAKDFDVLVLYDMWQDISDQAKGDFVDWLKRGKGLVVIHHAIASYQTWPEYSKIIGAHYYLAKTNVNGVEKARSAYQHGVHFKLTIVDPAHPVTKGVSDFEIHDETYKFFDVYETCHALVKTEEPLSNPVIHWAKNYGDARVVYMQSGHDHYAYDNPNYQKILRNAIQWTAKRN